MGSIFTCYGLLKLMLEGVRVDTKRPRNEIGGKENTAFTGTPPLDYEVGRWVLTSYWFCEEWIRTNLWKKLPDISMAIIQRPLLLLGSCSRSRAELASQQFLLPFLYPWSIRNVCKLSAVKVHTSSSTPNPISWASLLKIHNYISLTIWSRSLGDLVLWPSPLLLRAKVRVRSTNHPHAPLSCVINQVMNRPVPFSSQSWWTVHLSLGMARITAIVTWISSDVSETKQRHHLTHFPSSRVLRAMVRVRDATPLYHTKKGAGGTLHAAIIVIIIPSGFGFSRIIWT